MPGFLTLHSRTPVLSVTDPRGLAVRSVAYARVRDDGPAESRVARQGWDDAGRAITQWDPRLWGSSSPPNDRRVHALGGTVLRSDHVDAGCGRTLPAADGGIRWRWNALGDVHRIEVDSSGRPSSFFEKRTGQAERCVERRVYGGPGDTPGHAAGRLRVHDDEAGRLDGLAYDINGATTCRRRRYLAEPGTVDWPASEADLEAGGYETREVANPLGQVRSLVDARGHARRFAHDIGGRVARVVFQRVNGEADVVGEAVDYDAAGHASREVLGNGVTALADYDPAHGRLLRLRRSRPDRVLQDLRYTYDPVGNVLEASDDAVPTEWFAGEQVDPVSRYRYDSLSQLIEASGRENAASTDGPGLPAIALPGDGHRMRTYLEIYDYDAAGNLRSRQHVATGCSYTQTMRIDAASNRAVRDEDGSTDVTAAFDAAGRQRFLQRGQAMSWDGRGRLAKVVTVARPDGRDDEERYAYAADGERIWKRRRWWMDGSLHTEDVRYLPGLELRGDTEIVRVDTARCACRVVRSTSVEQTRYEIDDRLHSIALELDERGQIAGYEGYLPYGGSAWRAGRQLVEVGDRSRRHAGRERDATGLYDYGHRFYAPWLCRWMSPDPAGDVDGPNRYRFARGNPTSLRDVAGLFVDVAEYDPIEWAFAQASGASRMSRGLRAPDGAMSPDDLTTLVHGLQLASEVTHRAAVNLEHNALPDIDTTLSSIFGLNRQVADEAARLPGLRAATAEGMSRMHGDLQPRTMPGNDNFVWFDGPMIAGVMPGDVGQRIFINRAQLRFHDRTNVAFFLIHEQSHLTLRTEDTAYSTYSFMNNALAPQLDVPTVVSRYAPALAHMATYEPPSMGRPQVMSNAEATVIGGIPGGMSTYVQMSRAQRRDQMLSRNADTVATLAMVAGADVVAHWDRTRARMPRSQPSP